MKNIQRDGFGYRSHVRGGGSSDPSEPQGGEDDEDEESERLDAS